MIKLENTKVVGWEDAIRGMRNPKNSWDRSDSYFSEYVDDDGQTVKPLCINNDITTDWMAIGENDHKLMMSLAKGGPVHAKYRRFIVVYVDITAPLYWWKEADTYRIGVEKDSCSTMHKIHDKEFTLEDFSYEHLMNAAIVDLSHTIDTLNHMRLIYLHGGETCDKHGNWKYFEPKSKEIWWQMIQLLPSSYNQKRTVMISYEALANIYEYRRFHKLDEWREMCKWIDTLPYSEIITKPVVEKDSMVKIKTVVPEIVAYFVDTESEEKVPDYRCPECGFGVAEDYICCPHCMSKLDWENVKKPFEEFRKLIDSL